MSWGDGGWLCGMLSLWCAIGVTGDDRSTSQLGEMEERHCTFACPTPSSFHRPSHCFISE